MGLGKARTNEKGKTEWGKENKEFDAYTPQYFNQLILLFRLKISKRIYQLIATILLILYLY